MKSHSSSDDAIPSQREAQWPIPSQREAQRPIPMARYQITVEGQAFDVCVLDDPRQERVRVQVDGETFTVGVEDVHAAVGDAAVQAMPVTGSPTDGPIAAGAHHPLKSHSDGAPVEAAAADPVLKAPLPGVIKSIAVQPGQRVAVGDELLVIEAMKMDNVIRASRAGAVSTVYVTEAGRVAYGDPLLEFAD